MFLKNHAVSSHSERIILSPAQKKKRFVTSFGGFSFNQTEFTNERWGGKKLAPDMLSINLKFRLKLEGELELLLQADARAAPISKCIYLRDPARLKDIFNLFTRI